MAIIMRLYIVSVHLDTTVRASERDEEVVDCLYRSCDLRVYVPLTFHM